MVVATTRFGTMEVGAEDMLELPNGLLGFEACRRWTLLADAENQTLAWMQSLDRPELAVAVVSPRRFVPNYQLRLPARELTGLALARPEDAFVLAIVGRDERRGLTLNLKAPLVINLPRRIGRQVISSDDQPLDYLLQAQTLPLRRSA